MNENKRIFLTGALIAGLLLITPYYLQLIGLQPAEENGLSIYDVCECIEALLVFNRRSIYEYIGR